MEKIVSTARAAAEIMIGKGLNVNSAALRKVTIDIYELDGLKCVGQKAKGWMDGSEKAFVHSSGLFFDASKHYFDNVKNGWPD